MTILRPVSAFDPIPSHIPRSPRIITVREESLKIGANAPHFANRASGKPTATVELGNSSSGSSDVFPRTSPAFTASRATEPIVGRGRLD